MLRGACVVLLLAIVVPAAGDTYSITFDEEVRSEPATGRVILFFITEVGPEWSFRRPMNAPFYEAPQPIASVAVENWQPGEPVVIDSSVLAFPVPLNELDGPARVQAVLDLADNPERSHEQGPGNLYSGVQNLWLSAEREDHHWVQLTNTVEPRQLPAEQENLRWIELRSELLSEFYGRDVYHRAGISLPMQYFEENTAREQWPAVYVIPGYGGREDMALAYAGLFQAGSAAAGAMPHAAVIVLDPESPLGHHGFTDSPNHGPRGTALVHELIPHLESEFRIVSQPEGRIVTGHSSGGWTALWLTLNWPDVFGACWASAPDPIDFEAFQMTNLYEDESVYVMPDGEPTPSHRQMLGPDEEVVTMTVRQEALMEQAMHPYGGSGQQWDAWMAMFSPKEERTGFPARLFDAMTGKIHQEIVENHWSQFDIARRVVSDWDTLGPIVRERVRLMCGDRDSFYLDRAVRRFKEKVDALRDETDDDNEAGYIVLVEGADHNTIQFHTQRRWNSEMRDYLRRHGLHD